MFVVEVHDNPVNPDLWFFFVIYVTVLCEPSCNLNSILHICLDVPADFMHNIFLPLFFLIFAEVISATYVTLSLTLPKEFVRIQKYLTDLF